MRVMTLPVTRRKEPDVPDDPRRRRAAAASALVSGALQGLGSAGLFLTFNLPKLRTSSTGLKAHWRAVGSDVAHALERHGARTK